MRTTTDHIHQLARDRQVLWSSRRNGDGPDPVGVARLTRALDDAFEQRRMERARHGRGSRAEIIRRARIDSEIERLMQPD